MNNIISTQVKFFRNVKDYKFTNKLSSEQKEEISNLLKANKISSNDNVEVKLFCGEHITVISNHYELQKAVENASKIIDLLNKKINLSYSDEYGYLMSDLTKIGAGLMLNADICLTALARMNKIEQLKHNTAKLGYVLKETNQKHIYNLSTKCNLGISQTQIVDDFAKMMAKLDDLEVETAKMLDLNAHDEILDKTNRSIAILSSAHLLSMEELNALLLNIRIGLNLNLITLKQETLFKLQSLANNEEYVSKEDCKTLAEQVKEILKGEKDV